MTTATLPDRTASAADIATFYREHGYWLARGVFSPAEVAELERDFDRTVQQIQASDENVNARWGHAENNRIDGGDTVVIHTHNIHHFSAAWMRAMLQQRFLDITEAMLGPDIVLHHTKLFQKPPEIGSSFPGHQDWEYFATHTDSMMAGVIHISRATDAMGCLRVFPGSHRLGRVQRSFGGDGDFAARFPIENGTPIEAQPGDVVFFNYFTVHGSLPNRSPDVRKTVLVQLHAGTDEVENIDGHCHDDIVLRGWNSRMSRDKAGR